MALFKVNKDIESLISQKKKYFCKSVWSNTNNYDDKANDDIEKALKAGYEPISIACYNGPLVILYKDIDGK